MATQHTPGKWSVEEDPLGGDYMTYVVLPSPSGMFGTPIAHCQHNWNDAAVGERRISWKEAEANARLIAGSPELLATIETLLKKHEAHHNSVEHAAARALLRKIRGEA